MIDQMLDARLPYWFWQALYIALCLVCVGAIFALQSGRHAHARAHLYWSYSALIFGLGWEALDAWKYGVPGFPGSRWVLLPALAIVLICKVAADRRGQRAAGHGPQLDRIERNQEDMMSEFMRRQG